ncbi:hypothetical protein KY290_025448 [Solanum tuberosum]|uniref:Secreted protein n=1 Tax=Solanum tuberosum TaxID=4113 RepID=A0ABQ7UTQ9_SOLTU|nr:hypothetical protein KY290_025448 [Solanum tuberosum]
MGLSPTCPSFSCCIGLSILLSCCSLILFSAHNGDFRRGAKLMSCEPNSKFQDAPVLLSNKRRSIWVSQLSGQATGEN